MFHINISRKTIQFLIFLVDLLAYLLSVWLALFVRRLALPSFQYWYEHVKMFLPVIFYGICAMYLFGLWFYRVLF